MLRQALLGVVLALAAVLGGGRPSLAATNAADVSYDSFHDRLAGAGTWSHNARWGDVWRPNGVARDWRPYFDGGHWVYTDDYGWFWDGDDPWGDIAYHYGRWVFDPAEGWMWMPGYVWAPAWVYWRFGDGYVGWMPAPPDALFLAGVGIGLAFADWGPGFYGYAGWYGGVVGPADLWFFVGGNHFADVDFRRFAAPRMRAVDLVARTRNVTRFATVHGVVANRSIRATTIARLSGHTIRPVAAKTLLHGNPGMTPASAGRSAALQAHAAHPVPAAHSIVASHHTSTLPRTASVHHTSTTPRTASAHHHLTVAHVHRPVAVHHSVVHRPTYAHAPQHSAPRAFGGGPRPSMMRAPTTHAPAPHSGGPPKPHN